MENPHIVQPLHNVKKLFLEIVLATVCIVDQVKKYPKERLHIEQSTNYLDPLTSAREALS